MIVQKSEQLKQYEHLISLMEPQTKRVLLEEITQPLTCVEYERKDSPNTQTALELDLAASYSPIEARIKCIIELTYLLNISYTKNIPIEINLQTNGGKTRTKATYKLLEGEVSEQYFFKNIFFIYKELWFTQNEQTFSLELQKQLRQFRLQYEKINAKQPMSVKKFMKQIQQTSMFSEYSILLNFYQVSLLKELSKKHQKFQKFTFKEHLKLRWYYEMRSDFFENYSRIQYLLGTLQDMQQYNNFFTGETKQIEMQHKKVKEILYEQNLIDFLTSLDWKRPNAEVFPLYFLKESGIQCIHYVISFDKQAPSYLVVEAISDLPHIGNCVDFRVHNYNQINCAFPDLQVCSLSLPGETKQYVAFRVKSIKQNCFSSVIGQVILLIEQATVGLRILKPYLKRGDDLSKVPERMSLLNYQFEHCVQMLMRYYKCIFTTGEKIRK